MILFKSMHHHKENRAKKRLFAVMLLIVVLMLASTVSARVEDDWNDLNPENNPGERCGHGHTMIHINGKVFFFGGATEDEGWINVFDDLWQLTTNWEPVEPANDPPPPRYGHCAWLLNEKMVIHGGYDAEQNVLDDFWELDLSTYSWNQLTPPDPKPTGRAKHFGAVTEFGDLLMLGGLNQTGEPLDETWSYNPTTHAWTQKADIPYSVYGVGAVAFGPKMMILEVINDQMATYDVNIDLWHWEDVYFFIPKALQKKSNNSAMPLLKYSAYAQVGSDVFRMGGMDPVTFEASNETWKYNLNSLTWERMADMPDNLYLAGAAPYGESGEHVVLYGGMKTDETITDKTYVYYPEGTGVWQDHTIPSGFRLDQNHPNPFNHVKGVRSAGKRSSDHSQQPKTGRAQCH
jgi:N-acetylneuraminic acid mutarotase